MLRNRGSRFDTGWLVTFSFFFILVEKNLLRNFLSVAKMASLVYERENCRGDSRVEPQTPWSNCPLSLADASHEFQIHVSVRILTIKISQLAREFLQLS